MPKLTDEFSKHSAMLNNDLVQKKNGLVEFVEREKSGKCVATFHVGRDCISLRPAAEPRQITWCSMKRCADGAILIPSDDSVDLHIVELKSVLDTHMFIHARTQFIGMYVSALALGRLLGVAEFTKVKCYISCATSDVDFSRTASTVRLKVAAGADDAAAMVDWSKKTISLPLHRTAALSLQIRGAGVETAHFGAID